MKRIRRALTHITAGSVRKASVTYFLKTEIRVQKVRLHLALSRNLSGTEWGYLWSFPSGQEFPFGCWDSESWAQTWIEWTWRPRWLSGWFTEITAGLVWTGHFDHPLVSGPSESSLMLSHSYFRLRATFPTQKRSNTCRLRGQVAPEPPKSKHRSCTLRVTSEGWRSFQRPGFPCRVVPPNRRYGQHFSIFSIVTWQRYPKKVGIQVTPAASADGWLGGNLR